MATDSPSPVSALPAEYVERLEQFIADFIAERTETARSLSEEAAVMVELIGRLSSGGKRVRALMAFLTFCACGGDPQDERVLKLGAAIELFQSAALIYDDILDRSDTRRGMPSVHRQFEQHHRERQWDLDRLHFGTSAGILTGDMALSFSDELFAQVDPSNTALREDYDRMKWEVMAGQYLDVLAEVSSSAVPPERAEERALQVLRYKSAKYTFEHPAVLGALLAGAEEATAHRFAEFALPIGEAFQLVDDDLGVFGDEALTGKPAGDDLLEGKRTVLIAHALLHGTPQQKTAVEAVLGRADAAAAQIQEARTALEASGSRQHCTELAQRLADRELGHLEELEADLLRRADALPMRRQALAALAELASRVVVRTH